MTRKAKAPLTPERIMQYAWGYATTFVVEAALEHHVFDRLDESPRTVQELAVVTGTSPRGLSALLNALVGLQLVTRINDRYGLTPESAAFLVSTKPSFHGGVFRNFRTHLLPNWQQLPDVVRTGKPAKAVNQENAGPEFFAELVEAIFPLSYPAARRFGEHLGLAKAITPVSVLDIGAGAGVWGVALAQQSPQVLVRAVDWPRVLEITRKVAQRHGVADRLTTAPGDLLEADFGSGHDVATIGHILHSEGVERSRQLLRKTFAALAPGGTVAIMEFLCDDDRAGPPHALMFAVNMLVHTEVGDTFTFAEISRWLREAGFVNPRLLDVPAASPLILATKPKPGADSRRRKTAHSKPRSVKSSSSKPR